MVALQSSPTSHVAVIGAGAIGGLVAAAAASVGNEISLCIRTPFPALVIQEAGGPAREVPAAILSGPDQAKPADWVVVATKIQDTESARPWLDRLVAPGTVLVAAQNGIEQEERLRPYVGDAAVVPALVYAAAERVGPGHIVHHAGNRVVVPSTPEGRAFSRLVGEGELKVVPEDDFLTASWRKLMTNIAANPITALTMRRIGVMHEPVIRDLARALLEETVDVGRAAGADLKSGDVDAALELFATYNASGGTSMYYDRIAGLPLEHDHLTGAVVRAGKRYGVAVPINRAVLALLTALDGGLRSGEVHPARAA